VILEFLSVDDVLELHAEAIAEFGGDGGLRDRGLLESAVAQPAMMFGGQYLHRDPFEMAAAYFYSLILNHAFVDGNKRAGYAAALVFLDLNGWWIERPSPELYDAAIAVAEGTMEKEAVADLLRRLATTP
jgi:death-on-curing protein